MRIIKGGEAHFARLAAEIAADPGQPLTVDEIRRRDAASDFAGPEKQVAIAVAKLHKAELSLGLELFDAERELPPFSIGHVPGDEGFVWRDTCFDIIEDRANSVALMFTPPTGSA